MLNLNYRALFTLSFLTLALSAQAQPTPPGSPTEADLFKVRKQSELAQITATQQVLQKLQSCLQAAPNRKALESCHEAARAQEGRR